jgi:hypothetical protein
MFVMRAMPPVFCRERRFNENFRRGKLIFMLDDVTRASWWKGAGDGGPSLLE